MKILFMGTPEFARDQLSALWESRAETGWEIVGAVSQPDKPKGRGYKLIPTPVKEYATANNIPVFQPETVKDEAFAALLDTLAPDLIVVAAYGKMLPKNDLDFPRYGCINVHGSILPAYRGAAPIQRALMDGLKVTGNTIQYMAAGMDTGDIISVGEVTVGEDEDFGSLYDRMGKAGAELLLDTVKKIEAGIATRTPQDDTRATFAPKIDKAECRLDFSADARMLHNRIRALSPAPLAFAYLTHDGETKMLKLVKAEVEKEDGEHDNPGTVLAVDAKKGYISVACGKGILRVTALVPEGKGKMNAGDFIRGRKIAEADLLG